MKFKHWVTLWAALGMFLAGTSIACRDCKGQVVFYESAPVVAPVYYWRTPTVVAPVRPSVVYRSPVVRYYYPPRRVYRSSPTYYPPINGGFYGGGYSGGFSGGGGACVGFG